METTLCNISFQVPAGVLAVIVGANGSGKSTIIKLLMWMYNVDSGMGVDTLFIEKKLFTHGNQDNIFGPGDSLISREQPFLHVANFSSQPVTMAEEERLADSHTDSTGQAVRAETNISSKAQRNATEAEDPLAEEPIEGGPKTSEGPGDNISSTEFIEQIDISLDLSEEQHTKLEQVLIKNKVIFGLDGCLGNYAGK
ncbi:hypothetical protein B0H17DRAFT_1140747 [Mycena rosella]|uniref:ABC transporter domain-containing protein n=1 Tax=Mycena rosella TaxID=1033263 RepID=A0AAD7G7C8_MYCRO|nr:hypothetical protein B0H17DRAFT_1140747 [Mycena rosella]